MAEQSILLSFTPFGGAEFVFADPYDPDDFDPGEITHTIPASEIPQDGEYQSDSYLAPRVATIKGTIVGPDLGTVQSRLNAILSGSPKGGEGRLRQRLVDASAGTLSDYYLPCRVYHRQPGKQDGYPRREWMISYRSGSPLWREWSARSQVLYAGSLAAASQAVPFVPGGGENVPPVITFAVTAAGAVAIAPAAVGAISDSVSVTISADALDTWTFDCERRVLTRAGAPGVNQNARITQGGFFSLTPSGTVVTLTTGAGAGAGNFVTSWRQRFAAV